jgi:Tfp pilus assembly protein PilN
MAEINLLPKSKRKNLFFNLHIYKALSLVLMLIILAAFLVGSSLNQSKMINELQQLEATIENLQTEAIKADTTNRQLIILEEQLSSYASLFNCQPKWGLILNDINSIIPSEIWLTRIQISQGPAVILDGYSPSLEEVAEFTQLLKHKKYIKTSRLKQLQERQGNFDLLQFQIVCGLRQTGGNLQ